LVVQLVTMKPENLEWVVVVVQWVDRSQSKGCMVLHFTSLTSS